MIRIFLKKIWLLVLLLGLLLLLSSKLNDKMIRSCGFELHENTEVLITGSSLVTLGINPSIIPNSENVAMAAEPFVVSFFKLRDIISDSTNLKRVIISTSIQEISNQDEVFCGSKSVVVEMFSRLSCLKKSISLKDLKLFNVDKFSFWEVFIRNRVFPNYTFIKRYFAKQESRCGNEHLLHITGYEQGSDFNQGNIGGIGYNVERFIERQFRDDGAGNINSKVNFSYIDSINNLCASKRIELITVGMPISKQLYDKIPDCYKKEYLELKNHITSLSNTKFLDYTQMGEKKWFVDIVHLNGFGATSLTTILNNDLILKP